MAPLPREPVFRLYDRHVPLWRKLRRTDLIERAWLDRFLAALPPGPVLDLGCGNGVPIAAWLIGQGRTLTGVDGAPGLIAEAQIAFPDQTWIIADMRNFETAERFAGILLWHSLFHLSPDDQRHLLARLADLALPGAALMFTSGSADGVSLGEFGGEELYHASLDLAEYRALLDRAGFDILDHVLSDQSCGGATVWLARKRS